MEETPDENGRGDDQKTERLIAPEYAVLVGAARLLGGLLLERLDAGLNHDA
jgi:hypothetical protein